MNVDADTVGYVIAPLLFILAVVSVNDSINKIRGIKDREYHDYLKSPEGRAVAGLGDAVGHAITITACPACQSRSTAPDFEGYVDSGQTVLVQVKITCNECNASWFALVNAPMWSAIVARWAYDQSMMAADSFRLGRPGKVHVDDLQS